MVEEVLPDVPYAQLVFTIPKMLRPSFLWDRKLYGDLCRSAYVATKTFFARQFPELDDAVPAMVVAPQSFGNLANFHPHAHALTALGVFTRDGVFHPAPEDLDFNPVEELFREGLFKVLLKKEKITEERVELLKSWEHSGFRVHADRRVAAGERQELEALLQYFERPPVSLERLEYQDDGRVLYRGTRFHPGLRRDHQLTSGVEFLAMLVPHIALRHECRIHTYGALSTTIRRQLGWVDRKRQDVTAPTTELITVEEDSEFVRLRRKNWARLIAKVWKVDPELCEGCGQKMRVISAINHPHQDDVIERILRQRNQWDPPWQRERRARGPPRQREFFQGEDSQLPAVEEEDVSQDVPGADWES